MNPTSASSRHTFPLSLLLVILTGCAVLAAVLAPVVRDFEFDGWLDRLPYLVGAIIGCVLGGTLLGMIIGLHQFHRLSGVLFGAAIGAFLGPLTGLLMTVNRESLGPVVQAVLIGCAIMVATAWFIRPAVSANDPDEIIDGVEATGPRKT